MDTELARTFLAVVAAGSFAKAAERLLVTQSTVSARIQTLEQQFGCALFVRNRDGAALTAAGRRFQKHATILLRALEHARQDVGVPDGFRASLTIGGRIGIWEGLLLRSLVQIRAALPDIAIRAELGFDEDLMAGLVDGRIDIAVMYTPQARPGLCVEVIWHDDLVLVSRAPGQPARPGRDYVYVDWGPEFFAKHGAFFPEFTGPALSVNVGWLGLHHILESGGAGYFPKRLIAEHVAAGRLHEAPGAPVFRLPAYVVYPLERDDQVFAPALGVIRTLAAD